MYHINTIIPLAASFQHTSGLTLSNSLGPNFLHIGQSDLWIMQEKTIRRCWQQSPIHNGEFWVGVGTTKGTWLQTTAWLQLVSPACQPSLGHSHVPGILALLFQRLHWRIWESDCQPPVQLVGYALHSVLILNLVYIFSNPFLVLNRSLNKMIRTTTNHRVLTVSPIPY